MLKSVLLIALLIVQTGICNAATVGFDTLDPRFHGTVGESREIGPAVISVGYWQDGAGPRQAMMVSTTAAGVNTYTLLNVPAFNGVTSSTSMAVGISSTGSIVINAGYVGQGDRAVRVNLSSPNVGTVMNGLGGSYSTNGITGSGNIFGNRFSVVMDGSTTFTGLQPGVLLDGEISDGRTVGGVDFYVGAGTDGVNNYLSGWMGTTQSSLYNCLDVFCNTGRLDFNGNFFSSVMVGEQLGWMNFATGLLTLPAFSFGSGAIDRGLWMDNTATRLFYLQGGGLSVFDSRTNTGLQWNPYCIANATFCAAVATMALDISKGNSNGSTWVAGIDGTYYLTRNNASNTAGNGGSEVPEPASLFLVGVCLVGLASYGRNRKVKSS